MSGKDMGLRNIEGRKKFSEMSDKEKEELFFYVGGWVQQMEINALRIKNSFRETDPVITWEAGQLLDGVFDTLSNWTWGLFKECRE